MQKTMMCLSVCLLFFAGATAFAADEVVIMNPNYDAYIQAHSMETKPRDPAVVEAEKTLLVEGAQAVVDYAKANSVEQAAAEVTKGKDGVFAKYCSGNQFRILLWQYADEQGNVGLEAATTTLRGHNLFLNMIGMALKLDAFADLTGYKFLNAYREAAFSSQGQGWVTNLIWSDEFWANNNPVRYDVFCRVIDHETGVMVAITSALDE